MSTNGGGGGDLPPKPPVPPTGRGGSPSDGPPQPQFEYNVKKNFLRRLVFPMLFGPSDSPPHEGGGGLQRGGGGYNGPWPRAGVLGADCRGCSQPEPLGRRPEVLDGGPGRQTIRESRPPSGRPKPSAIPPTMGPARPRVTGADRREVRWPRRRARAPRIWEGGPGRQTNGGVWLTPVWPRTAAVVPAMVDAFGLKTPGRPSLPGGNNLRVFFW